MARHYPQIYTALPSVSIQLGTPHCVAPYEAFARWQRSSRPSRSSACPPLVAPFERSMSASGGIRTRQ